MENEKNFIRFMHCQIEKINLERQKVDRSDDAFIIEWIQLNSSNFREQWEKSFCKHCQKSNECGWKVLNNCSGIKEL